MTLSSPSILSSIKICWPSFSLPGTCSHSSIFSPTYLISNLINRGPKGSLCWVLAFSTASCLQLVWSPNWLNFLCTQLYNCSTSTFFLWASQIALIQPIHGQGYTLLFFDRMHLLFTKVHLAISPYIHAYMYATYVHRPVQKRSSRQAYTYIYVTPKWIHRHHHTYTPMNYCT